MTVTYGPAIDANGRPVSNGDTATGNTVTGVVTGTVAIDQTTPNTTNRVTAGLYGKVTTPGDTAILVTAAGRQLIAGGTANTAGAVITGGTVTSTDSSDVARAMAVAPFQYNGSTNEPMRNPNKFYDMSAVAIGSIATVATPTSGKKFRIMGGWISVSAAASVLFEDNAGGATVFRTPKLLVDTPFAFTLGGNGFLSAAANNVLKATSSASASITGTLYGTEE
jgi:hypothetical protein